MNTIQNSSSSLLILNISISAVNIHQLPYKLYFSTVQMRRISFVRQQRAAESQPKKKKTIGRKRRRERQQFSIRQSSALVCIDWLKQFDIVRLE